MDKKKLKILMIEDNEDDYLLIQRELTRAGINASFMKAETAEQTEIAVRSYAWDIILSDYNLPNFSGLKALEICKSIDEDVPFVIVTGAIGKESAVEIMKAGAQDYVFKGNLQRLPQVVLREIREREVKEEKKITESKLEATENKFKILFDNAYDSIFLWKCDKSKHPTVCAEANSIACLRLGYTREELLETSYYDLIDTNNASAVEARLQKLLQADSATYEEYLVTKCKNFIPVETNSHVISFAGESFILSVSRDISSRKENETIREFMYCIASSVSTTKDSQELYSVIRKELGRILDTTNFVIWLCSPNKHSITSITAAGEQDKVVNSEHQTDKVLAGAVIQEKKALLLHSNEIAKYSMMGYGDSESEAYLTWLGVPLTIRGDVIGLISVQSCLDEDAFNETHLKVLEFVSSQLALSITKKKQEDEIHFMNVQLEERVKKRTAALNDALSKYEQTNAELLTVNKRLADESLKLMRLNEKYAESERQLMELNRQLEDRVEERTQQLVVARDRAEEMNKLKSIILGNLGHELRTPLNGILGTIQFVKSGTLSEEDMDEVLEMMNDSAARLNNSITSLLGLMEIEANQRQLYIESVRLSSGVESFFYNTAVNMAKKEVIINLDIDDNDIYCDLDESLLFQTLYNIVDNAIKFTSRGTIQITVGSAKELGRNWGIIQVRDTGKGISQINLGMIFEPFRQESEGVRRSYEGIGIGLTIAKKTIEMMNGSISVESTEGQGSIFTIRFPGYYL